MKLTRILPNRREHGRQHREPDDRGFARVDLLTIIILTAILFVIQLSALGHSRSNSRKAQCADNFRHLMTAWRMYADDHAGALAANRSGSVAGLNWVAGWLDFNAGNADNTNELKLISPQQALLGPYIDSPQYFRCPSDLSTVANGTRRWARVRSVSMNAWVGGTDANSWAPGYKCMLRAEDMTQPARTLVLLEEHPDSINDGDFFTIPGTSQMLDIPAAFHEGGMTLGLADGQVDFWLWKDSRISPPPRYNGTLSGAVYPSNFDLQRINGAATYRQ